MIKKWNDFVREFKSASETPGPAEGTEAYIDSKMQELKDLVDGFSEGHSLIYEWESGGDHRLDINFSAGDLSVGYEFDIDDLRVSKVVGDEVDTEFGGDVHSLEEGLDIIEKDIHSVLGISEKLLTEAYSEKSAPERLAFWEDFLHRFKSARNKARREISSEDYARMKDADLFHDDEPRCDFLDEWDLEGIKADWKGGIVRSRVYGSEKDFRIVQFDGFKNPDIGDIVVYFRFCAWLFKPDAEFNYAFSSSAVSSGNSNMWDDIQYMDRFCRSYRFGLRKDEIPAVVRTKATRKIRPVYGEEGHGYKIGRKRIEDGRGFKYESLASFEEFGEWIDEASGKRRRKVPAKYLTGPHPGKMRKEIDTFIGKKQYKKDWDADYTSGKGGKGKRVKTKKSAATKAYQRMFGKKED